MVHLSGFAIYARPRNLHIVPYHLFGRPAPRPSRHQIDTSDLTACSMEDCLYARLRAVGRCFFLCFFPSHPSRTGNEPAKSLDETPESDQEVVSERREMSPPSGKKRGGLSVAAFSFPPPRASTTTADPSPPSETRRSRDRLHTAGCILYGAAGLIRARIRQRAEETLEF